MGIFRKILRSKNEKSRFIIQYDHDERKREYEYAEGIQDLYPLAMGRADRHGFTEIHIWYDRPGSGLEIDDSYLWKDKEGRWHGEWGEGIWCQYMDTISVPVKNKDEAYCPQCLGKNVVLDCDEIIMDDPSFIEGSVEIECKSCGCVADVELDSNGCIPIPIEFNCDIHKKGAGYSAKTLIHYSLMTTENKRIKETLQRPDVQKWIEDYINYVEWLNHGNGPSLSETAEEGFVETAVEFLMKCTDKNNPALNDDTLYEYLLDEYDNSEDVFFMEIINRAFQIGRSLESEPTKNKSKKPLLTKKGRNEPKKKSFWNKKR